MVNWLEGIILAGFSLFFMVAPYEIKYSGKVFFVVGSIGLLIIMFLKYKYRFYRGFLMINPLNKPFLFFGFACLFSILFSFNPSHSQGIFFDRYLVYFTFFLIGFWLIAKSLKNLYFLVFVFILAGFVFGVGGIRDMIYWSRINPSVVERLWTVFGRYIPYYNFPLYLVYFTPFSFSISVFSKNKWFKVVGLISLILGLFCLVFNTSRAAWLAILLAAVFIICLKASRVKGVILFVLIFLIFLSAVVFNKQERLKTIIDPNQWSGRLPLYKSAIAIFRDYPLWGVGVGMFEKVLHYSKYELPLNYPVAKELNLHAHNTYLEVAAEMGLLGLLSFLSIFVTFFWKAIKKIRSPGDMSKNTQAIFIGLSASVFAALVFAFSTTYITVGVNNSCYFWLLFGMAAGMLNREDDLKAGTVPTMRGQSLHGDKYKKY
ncbi:MAG: O-antigen ligase family protein [Candidatus Omnitrophica bacterium]|nr:O-antigen ligase family protein [Candidatus Omnitrophota bacterium]